MQETVQQLIRDVEEYYSNPNKARLPFITYPDNNMGNLFLTFFSHSQEEQGERLFAVVGISSDSNAKILEKFHTAREQQSYLIAVILYREDALLLHFDTLPESGNEELIQQLENQGAFSTSGD